MSATKLYVGNLSYDATENDLEDLFASHGEVSDTFLVMDRNSGRSRGFAFVTLASEEQAEAAIAALHDSDWMGRKLTINIARPREEGGGGGNRGGGGGNRGGGGGNRGGGGGRGRY